jgi:hypothetical protein
MAPTLSFWKHAAVVFLAVLLPGSCALLYGNDALAEFAAGGIQLRHETRISMEEERLAISLGGVTVEYKFLNSAGQDITTEVAFPIPPYAYDPSALQPRYPYFTDFRVWADGQEVKYQTEVRAKLGDADFTDLLRKLGIDIETFGHSVPDVDSSQIRILPKSAKEKLVRLGLIDAAESPRWSVHKIYFWRQRFPAHKILNVRHEYGPIVGYYQIPPGPSELEEFVKESCLPPSLETKLSATANRMFKEGSIHALGQEQVVKYILTTANTWRTPIKDFQLVVERPETTAPEKTFVSFCWDGEVQRLDKDHFIARRADFVPARELVVYYLQGDF